MEIKKISGKTISLFVSVLLISIFLGSCALISNALPIKNTEISVKSLPNVGQNTDPREYQWNILDKLS